MTAPHTFQQVNKRFATNPTEDTMETANEGAHDGSTDITNICPNCGIAAFPADKPGECPNCGRASDPQGDPGGVGALDIGTAEQALSSEEIGGEPSKYSPEPEPEIPDFAQASDFDASASLAEPAELDDTGVSLEDLEEKPIAARTLGEHLEKAPANVELPEKFLPVGTDIHIEQPGVFLFKLPGKPGAIGRGRTIYGAMVNAGIIR